MNKERPADMRGKTDMRGVFARKRAKVLEGVVAVVISCGELQNLGLKSAQVTILDKRSHPLAPGDIAYLTFKRSERCITLDDINGTNEQPTFIMGSVAGRTMLQEGWKITWSNKEAGIWLALHR